MKPTVRHYRIAVRATEYIVIGFLVALGLLLAAGANPAAPVRPYAVVSGSMAPAIPRGALVMVTRRDTYVQGDIVTIASGDPARPVTHRIVDFTADGRLITRGDANPAPDPVMRRTADVIGAVRWHIPWIGYPIAIVRTVPGFILLVVIPATLIAYHELLTLSTAVERRLRRRSPV